MIKYDFSSLLNFKSYQNFSDCLDKLKNKYSPVIISTDLSKDSLNILEINQEIEKIIPKFCQDSQSKSIEILNRLIYNNQLSHNDLKIFKEDFNFEANKEKYLNTQFFLEKILTSTELLNLYDFNKEEKPKICVIVFGNESRGISEFIRKKSDFKIIIPQYGHNDVSFNISVSCGIVLFNFLSNKFLPGNFLDHKQDDAMDILLRSLINSLNNNHKKVSDILRKNNKIEDY